MTCRFLDNLTLESLVAPVPKGEFRTRYWEKQPLVVHRDDPGYYDGLFGLRDFDQAISCNPAYIKLANAVTNKNLSYKSDRAPGIESVLADMRDGGTLVLDQMHNHNPNLGLLCRLLGQQLGHRFQTNLYLTPPNGKGFTPHWDNHDVFILQMVGSKNWKIEKERRVLPSQFDKMGDEGRELRGELLSFTIAQGDVVYIPRGFVHAAECGTEPSLHITLGVSGTFVEDLLVTTIRAAIRRKDHLRTTLPLGFHRNPGKDLVKIVLDALGEISDEAFVTTAVDGFRDELIKNCPLDVSGQVLDFFEPTPIQIDDMFGPRRGIFYTLHFDETGARVNFGARSIAFPDFFREALEFALKTPSFAVRDLPGEIEDSERIVFIERLKQEGLVVRATHFGH
jgi:ribosomal protein L16 Arg81 hydroxylase